MKYIDKKIINKFKKDDWEEVVSRLNYPLLNSFLRTGVLVRNKDLDFDSSLSCQLLLNPKIYALKSDILTLDRRIKNQISKDVDFISNYLNYLEQHCQSYNKLIKDLAKSAQFTSQKDELLKLFIEYRDATQKIISHIYPPLSLEKYMLQKIEMLIIESTKLKKDSKELNNLIQQLITPEKMSAVMKREFAILKLADRFALKEINKNNYVIISEHEEYSWLSDHAWDMSKESLNDFLKAIKISKKSDPAKKIKEIKKDLLKTKKEKKYLASKYKLDAQIISLCHTASILPILRAMRLDVILHSRHILDDNLFKKISKILKTNNINKYYYWEIESILKNQNINIELIEKRVLKHSFLASKLGICLLDKQEREAIENKMMKSPERVDTIKGMIASLGRIEGVVRIINHKNQYNNFNEGEILVTSMTTPDFVPLMKKSSAIITDEGGISCHAAIVSREMKKPCIIGTKIATQVLRDGDMVEVDANQGIIKIIS